MTECAANEKRGDQVLTPYQTSSQFKGDSLQILHTVVFGRFKIEV